jgi:hypothetical protein
MVAALQPHSSHPLLRPTFAPAPRPCPAHSLEDHRPSPRTRRCLHAFALLLHLYWRFPCRCFSPLFLLFSFLVCLPFSPCPRTPALFVPRCPLCICLLSFLNPVVTVPNHSPKFSPWCGGVVGNWRRGILGSIKPNLRRLSDASDERIGERIEQGSGGTDTARRWWPARGGRVSCATRRRSPP